MSIWGNVASPGGLQSDWAQTDPRQADYIRSKPDLAPLTALAQGALPRSGGAMEGDLSMEYFRLTRLPQPQQEDEAANKAYVDSCATVYSYVTVTLTAQGWTAENDGFTQRIYCEGITGEDRPHYGILYSGDRETDLAAKEDWAKVDDLDTAQDTLTFTCLQEKPQGDLTVQLELRRAASAAGTAAVLTLTEDTSTAVTAEVEDTLYGVENATVNSQPTDSAYDFTVL